MYSSIVFIKNCRYSDHTHELKILCIRTQSKTSTSSTDLETTMLTTSKFKLVNLPAKCATSRFGRHDHSSAHVFDFVTSCRSKARKSGPEEIPRAQLQRNPHGRNSPSYVRAKIHSPLDLELNTPETKEHLRHDEIYRGDTKIVCLLVRMHKAPPADSSADPAEKEKEHKKNLDRDARAHGPHRLNNDRVSGCRSRTRKSGSRTHNSREIPTEGTLRPTYAESSTLPSI